MCFSGALGFEGQEKIMVQSGVFWFQAFGI